MPELELEFTASDGRVRLPGFRLRRLEILNWGTFHGKVHRLVPGCRWTLLVGENGSGKTTAVDALRTLLVPPRLLQRSYNDSSGEQKRGDRTRRSYVRGAWATASHEESASVLTQYLRREGDHSIILAVFANERTGAEATLAQVLWELNEQVHEIFAISPGDREIATHLTHLGKTNELSKTLKARGWKTWTEFSGYAEEMRRLLGIPGQGAMEVFNQAIGVKEVTDVNDFIRRHMLATSDAVEFIRGTLEPSYANLSKCWDAIKLAERQIAALDPIAEFHARIEEATRRKIEFEELGQAVPIHYSRRHLELRAQEENDIRAALVILNQRKATLEDEQQRDSATRDGLLLEQHQVGGGRLRELTTQIEQAQQDASKAEQLHDRVQKDLGLLGRKVPLETEEAWHTLVGELGELRPRIVERGEQALAAQVAAGISKTDATRRRDAAAAEAESLRKHQVLIPREFVFVRSAICEEFGIPAVELPYAGELIEVKSEFRADWTPVIERLLRSFGISLLVPDAHYNQVAPWINGRRLSFSQHGEAKGLRLVFHRVPPQTVVSAAQGDRNGRRVSERLNFRTEHKLHRWVINESQRRFHHVCCNSVEELSREPYGVTREGLIREGPTRHVKDDRFALGDRSQYVLGWSIDEKLRALKEEVEDAQHAIDESERVAKRAQADGAGAASELAALDAVLAVTLFAALDFRSIRARTARLTHEKEELETSSDRLKALKEQLRLLDGVMEGRRKKIEALIGEAGGKNAQLDLNTNAQQQLRLLVSPFESFDLTPYEAALTEIQAAELLTLENADAVASRVAKSIAGSATHQTKLINQAKEEMLPKMADFLSNLENNSLTADLAPRVEFGGDFTTLRDKLRSEDLPKHRKEFERYLSENLIGAVATLNSKLGEHEKAIRERIGTVNIALRDIPFSATTYIHIVDNRSTDQDVSAFRAELRQCIAGGLQPSDETRLAIFMNIQRLITQFREKPDWMRKVTDARNWLIFGMSERENATGIEVNMFTDSSGKSGGQKARLAFTILASAIAAQYGLAGLGDESSNFRLLVIDEAFARTDEPNSQQALELFRKLGLQLLVVSPFDAKARIVEDHVESFHLAMNPERNNSSIKRATLEEYAAARDESLGQ